MTEEQFYQKIKEAIISNEIFLDAHTFQPINKVVLYFPLTIKNEELSQLSKERMYYLIGKAIIEGERKQMTSEEL